jgi:oligopeptide transport system substrate-binding protein
MMRSTIICGALLSLLASTACGGKKQTSAGGSEKVFGWARQEAYKSLDPVKQMDQASFEIISNVYDSLLQYNYLKRPYQVEPNLVTKMPELGADGLTYAFELRPDVRWNDDACFPGGKGRTLVADDVIYSFKRFADANLNVLSYTTAQGAFEGMDAFREQTKQLGPKADYAKLGISGIKKVDDRHFTIKLTRANPLALFVLSTVYLSIVPHEAVDHYKDQFEHHPVGSGPFFIKQMSRRGVIVLAKNPHYHQTYPTEGAPGDAERGLLAAAGKRLPLIDEVNLPLIEESQPQILKFMNGDLDWVPIDRDNFVKMATKDASGFHLKPEYAGKFAIYSEPDLRTEYFVFNTKDPLVGKNTALREAIGYAMDVPKFIDQMRNGRAVPLKTIVPNMIAGSERDVPAQWFTHDPEMAKKKLAEAGYPGGKGLPPIVMDYRASTTLARHDYEFLRAELAEVGITLTAEYQTFSAFLKKVESGNFQMTEQAWGADYPDAENFYQLLYGPNKTPGPNAPSYENSEYDKLYEQIRYMPNGPERFALFARMNEIIRRDLPMIFTWNYTLVGLHHNWVKNFKRNAMVDVPFKYFDIDSAIRAKGVH